MTQTAANMDCVCLKLRLKLRLQKKGAVKVCVKTKTGLESNNI